MYTNGEKNDMLFCYYYKNRDPQAAADLYYERYMERRQPHRRLFINLEKNLSLHGCFKKPKSARKFKETVEENVLAYVNFNSKCSTAEIAHQCNTSKETARNVLKNHNYKPFHYSISNTLYPGDMQRRMRFCQWYVLKCRENPDFWRNVMFTDETRFTNNGIFNRHNNLMWCRENPHINAEKRNQNQFGINVWCGIFCGKIIGPYFYNDHLNGRNYLNFLQHCMEEYFDDLPLLILRHLKYFQHDGAPAHNSREVKRYLHERFDYVIGNNLEIDWPARSPDLTPLDFFLWGILKNKVYAINPENLQDLKDRIQHSIREIDMRTINKVLRSVHKRCVTCIQNGGGHFEHLM